MQTLRILVAEDDKLSATLLKAMLEAEGHSVCAVASTGRSTIEAALEHKPDAVLMDIYLADEVSGVDAARSIVYDLGIPTIFITGASDPAIMDVAAESGALSFIKKPVSADELRANLRILLHHQTVTAALRKTARRHQALLDCAPMGIFLCNHEGTLLECNTTFAAMLGYASPVALMQAHQNIDELACEEERFELVVGMLAAGACVNGISGALKHKDGSIIHVREYGTAYTGEDGDGYQGIVIQTPSSPVGIAESDLGGISSSFLRSTIDAVTDLVVVMDRNRTIIEANKAFYRHLGSNGNAKLTSGFAFAGPEHICSGGCPFSRFLEDNCEHAGWVRLTKDGPEYYNTVSPVTNNDGQVVAAVQVFRAMPKGGKV